MQLAGSGSPQSRVFAGRCRHSVDKSTATFITPYKYELLEKFMAFDEKIKNKSIIKFNFYKDNLLALVNRINKYHPINIINTILILSPYMFSATVITKITNAL